MRRQALGARDFLVLVAALEVALVPVAGWGVHAGVAGWPAALLGSLAGAGVLALLGLFMTWGDGGSRVRNAARSLFVLIALVAGVIALLVWGASTAGGGG
jgi:hypothetical protein